MRVFYMFVFCTFLHCGTPAGQLASNLLGPGLVCAESALLDVAGVGTADAVVAQCTQFGAVVVSDVYQLAKMLLAQLFPPREAGVGLAAMEPLEARLRGFAAQTK